jgi:hypothetical protein
MGELSQLKTPGARKRMLDILMRKDAAVYAKPCLTHTGAVVAYLDRYSHRIALSDYQLLAVRDGRVTLRNTDYRDHNRHKFLTLNGEKLIRRFLLHVLPKGSCAFAGRLSGQSLPRGKARAHSPRHRAGGRADERG